MKIQKSIELRCPETLEPLTRINKDTLRSESGLSYPIIDGVPILISPKNKMFDVSQVASPTSSGFPGGGIRRLSRLVPQPTINVGGRRFARRLSDHVQPTLAGCEIRPTALAGGSTWIEARFDGAAEACCSNRPKTPKRWA